MIHMHGCQGRIQDFGRGGCKNYYQKCMGVDMGGGRAPPLIARDLGERCKFPQPPSSFSYLCVYLAHTFDIVIKAI